MALRDDLGSGELSLSMFAADLYDVAVGRGPSVYRAPQELFALTYPTVNLREMVKDVLLRLAGQNDKAVRQLEPTYGGGKTHALITLYYLVHAPETLPDLPSVREFRQHAGGMTPPKARIQESAINPEALLPEGPYNLWRPGATSRRASDLLRAFAQFPHLPKMLRQKDIADTLALGCEQGYFVLHLPRPDHSVRTFWRTRPTEVELKERDLEVVLPEAAELTEIDGHLLAPGAIPGLWPADGSPLGFGALVACFDGEHVSTVQKEGYDERLPIPRAPREAVERAVSQAVKAGMVWLIAGPAGLFKEGIPLGVLNDTATLHPPPPAIAATGLLPQNLVAAWGKEVATAPAGGETAFPAGRRRRQRASWHAAGMKMRRAGPTPEASARQAELRRSRPLVTPRRTGSSRRGDR